MKANLSSLPVTSLYKTRIQLSPISAFHRPPSPPNPAPKPFSAARPGSEKGNKLGIGVERVTLPPDLGHFTPAGRQVWVPTLPSQVRLVARVLHLRTATLPGNANSFQGFPWPTPDFSRTKTRLKRFLQRTPMPKSNRPEPWGSVKRPTGKKSHNRF